MPEETQNANSQASIRRAQNDFNALRIRLDTEELLNRIEFFLRGKRQQVLQTKTGDLVSQEVGSGTALANEEGVQAIMSWVSMIINPQTVQGNFPADRHGYSITYEQSIYNFRLNFGTDIVLNMPGWDIKEENAEGIIDRVCQVVEIFLSRCIDNEERKSYSETMKSIDTNITRAKGGIPMFNKAG